MCTLLHFSRRAWQRSLSSPPLLSGIGIGVAIVTLLHFSRGERQRSCSPPPLPSGIGVVVARRRAEVMLTSTSSFWNWDEGWPCEHSPTSQEEHGRGHCHLHLFFQELGLGWPWSPSSTSLEEKGRGHAHLHLFLLELG